MTLSGSNTFFSSGSPNTLGYDSWYLLPFGRGYVSVQDNNAYSGKTTINPRYFQNPFDRLAQAATVKFSRTISQATPLSNDIVSELTPGTKSVAQGASLEAYAQWVENNYRSNWVNLVGDGHTRRPDHSFLAPHRDSCNDVTGAQWLRGLASSRGTSHVLHIILCVHVLMPPSVRRHWSSRRRRLRSTLPS
jgi:hypothetical protein